MYEGGDDAMHRDQDATMVERRFSYYAGLLDTHEVQRFERMAFRISRGNMFMNKEDIIMDNTHENEIGIDCLENVA